MPNYTFAMFRKDNKIQVQIALLSTFLWQTRSMEWGISWFDRREGLFKLDREVPQWS